MFKKKKSVFIKEITVKDIKMEIYNKTFRKLFHSLLSDLLGPHTRSGLTCFINSLSFSNLTYNTTKRKTFIHC